MTLIHRIIAPITMLVHLLLMLLSMMSSCISEIATQRPTPRSVQQPAIERTTRALPQDDAPDVPQGALSGARLQVGLRCEPSEGLCEETWSLESEANASQAGVVVLHQTADDDMPLDAALGALQRVLATRDDEAAPRLLALLPADAPLAEGAIESPCATVIACIAEDRTTSPSELHCTAHSVKSSELLCFGDELGATEGHCFWCGDRGALPRDDARSASR